MAEQTVQSIERCFTLLEQLASRGRLGVSELSRLTGLHKATVYRLLQTLLELQYVRQAEDGRYELTLRLVRLSSELLEQKDLPRRMHPYLVRLAEETGETVHLVQREGSRIVYLDKVESDRNAVRMVSRVGMVRDMPCTAVGKAILAAWGAGEIQDFWKRNSPQPVTARTITDLGAFQHELEVIRQRGFAVDREENEVGVCCVAAALRDESGRYTYAFSISAPAERMPEERLMRLGERLLFMRRQMENGAEP